MNTGGITVRSHACSAGELLIRPTGCVRPAPLTLGRASPQKGSPFERPGGGEPRPRVTGAIPVSQGGGGEAAGGAVGRWPAEPAGGAVVDLLLPIHREWRQNSSPLVGGGRRSRPEGLSFRNSSPS